MQIKQTYVQFSRLVSLLSLSAIFYGVRIFFVSWNLLRVLFGHVHFSQIRALFDCALYNLFYLLQVLVHRCRNTTELNGKPISSSNTKKKLWA